MKMNKKLNEKQLKLWIGKWTPFQKTLNIVSAIFALFFLIGFLFDFHRQITPITAVFGIIAVTLAIFGVFSLIRTGHYKSEEVLSSIEYRLWTRLFSITPALIVMAVLFFLGVHKNIGLHGIFLIGAIISFSIFGIRTYLWNKSTTTS